MKNLLKVLLVFAILSGCTSNDVEKSSANHDKSNPFTVVSEVELEQTSTEENYSEAELTTTKNGTDEFSNVNEIIVSQNENSLFSSDLNLSSGYPIFRAGTYNAHLVGFYIDGQILSLENVLKHNTPNSIDPLPTELDFLSENDYIIRFNERSIIDNKPILESYYQVYDSSAMRHIIMRFVEEVPKEADNNVSFGVLNNSDIIQIEAFYDEATHQYNFDLDNDGTYESFKFEEYKYEDINPTRWQMYLCRGETETLVYEANFSAKEECNNFALFKFGDSEDIILLTYDDSIDYIAYSACKMYLFDGTTFVLEDIYYY